jgi:electron transfer flavoprotein beta subunit
MAAKKKPVESLTLAGIGVDGDEVGGSHSSSTVLSATPKPPKSAGEKITDEGEGGQQIADYLVAQKLL